MPKTRHGSQQRQIVNEYMTDWCVLIEALDDHDRVLCSGLPHHLLAISHPRGT